MHPPVSAEVWAALRELRERRPPTFPRLAAVSGLHVTTVRERAAREGWQKQDFQSRTAREAWSAPVAPSQEVSAEAARLIEDASPAEALERLMDLIARQMAEIIAEAEASGRAPDKAHIDALYSLMRLAERTLALRHQVPGREEQEEKTEEQKAAEDAELAERFRRIDARIMELAEARAEWLLGQRQHRE